MRYNLVEAFLNTIACSRSEQDQGLPRSSSDQQWTKTSEQHRAFTASRKSALREIILVHLLPVAATISILQLSFFSVYWADSTKYHSFNEILNSLQYASKALELLIAFSIYRIILHRTRYLMVYSALPLGFLAVGYEPSLLSVLSPEFWLCLRPSAGGYSRWIRETLPSICLITICVTLLLVVGPSSAVAILPNLDWWRVNPFKNVRVSVWARPSDGQPLWPTNLTTEVVPDKRCFEIGADQVYACSSQNWQAVQYWSEDLRWRRTSPNLTVQVQSFNAQRYLVSTSDLA